MRKTNREGELVRPGLSRSHGIMRGWNPPGRAELPLCRGVAFELRYSGAFIRQPGHLIPSIPTRYRGKPAGLPHQIRRAAPHLDAAPAGCVRCLRNLELDLAAVPGGGEVIGPGGRYGQGFFCRATRILCQHQRNRCYSRTYPKSMGLPLDGCGTPVPPGNRFEC